MKIFIFGHTGMLGRYVSTYFKSKNYEVIEIGRELTGKISLIDARAIGDLLMNAKTTNGDIVINCIGIIKHLKNVDDLNFILINAVYPRVLADVCEHFGVHMIHPSTDCVFSGLRGLYCEDDPHDALDVYGKTKSLGEPKNATVIRTSIIGEELKGKLSFIEWVKSNKGKTVNGFINHIWNGITCLEFVKLCEQLIITNKYWLGAKHVFTTEPIAKYKLVELVSNIYGLNLKVNPIEVPVKCDRSLITTRKDVTILTPTYSEQIIDLLEYQSILNG
jgi:dTDP-4-dehydrorhamnose reductase